MAIIFKNFFCNVELHLTSCCLSGYNGEPLDVKGKYVEITAMLEFYVVNTHTHPILGLKAYIDMDLNKLVLSVHADSDGHSA